MAGRDRRVLHLAVHLAGGGRASVLGLFARKAAFLRTPKTSEQAKWWEALRANWAEPSLALLGIGGHRCALTRATQLSGPLLAGPLLFPTLGMAAAPFNQKISRPRQIYVGDGLRHLDGTAS